MPLLPQTLSNGLSFMKHPDTYPKTYPEFAQNFADALLLYFSACIVPSTTIAAAKAACASFLTANAGVPNVLENGCMAFFTAYIPGCLPAFAVAPPVAALSLAPVYSLGMSNAPAENIISLLVSTIDAWARTSLATNTASGVVIPLS